MFGYVIVNKAEMKFKDYDVYHAYYCGLCKRLKDRYGRSGQATLSYDMTFLILLLTGLYEPKSQTQTVNCLVHPLEKHPARTNLFSDYAADMNLLLSYYKCLDDWIDEQKTRSYVSAKTLQKKSATIQKKYPQKAAVIEQNLRALSRQEKAHTQNIDQMAGYFGELMAEIFAYQQDPWEGSLRKIGFFLGKFIYLMDAYDDVEEDQKKGNYNCLETAYLKQEPEEFSKYCKELMMMMLSECSREFEKLPILVNAEILRNILYSGVWGRYNSITQKRTHDTTKENSHG